MKQTSRFWDWIAERYARTPIKDEAAYRKKLEVTRGLLRPDMEFLEIGCGTGSTALIHAPHVKHIRAIDISSRMIDIARGKAAEAGIGNVFFEQAVIDDFSAPEGSLDGVFAFSILHLLDNWRAVIARVHGLLEPGGVFVTSTSCLGDSMGFLKFVLPIGSFLRVLPPVEVFTEKELVGALTGAGFAIDHRWLPGKGKAVFIVARKPG